MTQPQNADQSLVTTSGTHREKFAFYPPQRFLLTARPPAQLTVMDMFDGELVVWRFSHSLIFKRALLLN
jgi:hypothetical protein